VGQVKLNNEPLKPFKVYNGLKHKCVLASTLFSIFFSMTINHAFLRSDEGRHNAVT